MNIKGTRLQALRALSIFAATCFVPSFGFAAVIVNSSADDALGTSNKRCTLREAISNVVHQTQVEPDCDTGFQTNQIVFDHIDAVHLDPSLDSLSIDSKSIVQIQGPVDISFPAGGTGERQFSIENGSRLELDDVTLENGLADEGGLILVQGDLLMSGGAVRNGLASVGGAIAIHGSAALMGVEFSNNRAQAGGAVKILQPATQVVISDCEFFDNRATDFGGAISDVSAADLKITRTSFIANLADGLSGRGGGALYIDSDSVDIEDSVIRRNISRGSIGGGGGHFEAYSNVNIVNTVFEDNQALSLAPSASGGGFFHGGGGGSVKVRRSNFRGNLAWVGGAVSIAPGASLEFDNTTLTGNFADRTAYPARPDSGSGSAVYADSSTVGFHNVTIKDNEGVSQLTASNSAKVSFSNTIAWTKQGVLNCDGQGTFIDVTSSLQNVDGAGASCFLPTLAGSAATAFEASPKTFNSPDAPPVIPVTHQIWPPKAGGPLSKKGDKTACLDPLFTESVDERNQARSIMCDIGAVEGP